MEALLAQQGFNPAAPESVPTVFAHAAPMLRFAKPAGNKGSVVIDEVNDDLVVVDGGSVTFARCAILDDNAASSGRAISRSRAASEIGHSLEASPSRGPGNSTFVDFNETFCQSQIERLLGIIPTGASSHTGSNAFGTSPSSANAAAAAAGLISGASFDGTASMAPLEPEARHPTEGADDVELHGYSDVLRLDTTQTQTLLAKRCATRTSAQQHGGLVAVLHDPYALTLYNLHPVDAAASTAQPQTARGSAAAAATASMRSRAVSMASATSMMQSQSQSATTPAPRHMDPANRHAHAANASRGRKATPLSVYHCRPGGLRYGTSTYAIRDFFWLPAPVAWASGGTKLRAPSSTQLLLLVTEVTIELLQISPFATKPEQIVVLQQRITTRSDFCTYDRVSRVLVSINAKKPNVVKPFVVTSRVVPPSAHKESVNSSSPQQQARRPVATAGSVESMRTVRSDAAGGGEAATDGYISTSSGAVADQGPSDAPSAVIAASPQAASNARSSVLALPEFRLSDSEAAAEDTATKHRRSATMPLSLGIKPVTLYDRLHILVHTKQHEGLLYELQGYRAQDPRAARFTKVGQLCFSPETKGAGVVSVIDNLLVVHCRETGNSFVFDVHLDSTLDPQYQSTNAGMSYTRGQVASSTSPRGSSAGGHGGVSASFDAQRQSSVGPGADGRGTAGGMTSSTSPSGRNTDPLIAQLSAPMVEKPDVVAEHMPVVVVQPGVFASRIGAALMAEEACARRQALRRHSSGEGSRGAVLSSGSSNWSPVGAVGAEVAALEDDDAPPPAPPVAPSEEGLACDPVRLAAQESGNTFRNAEYYDASSPLLLDVDSGRVLLLGINPAGFALQMPPYATRTLHFLANRAGAGAAMAAVHLIRQAIQDQEPLAYVGRMLDVVTDRERAKQSVTWHASHVSRAAVTKGTTNNAARANPVASDGQFHVRRAMPRSFRVVAGDLEAARQVILDLAPEAQPSPAHGVRLSFLHVLDAEHGVTIIDELARSHKPAPTTHGASSPASVATYTSPSASQPASRVTSAQPSSTASPIASPPRGAPARRPEQATNPDASTLKTRIPQQTMVRLVFDPLLEVLRAKRDAELEHDEHLTRTRYYLRYLRAVVLEYGRALMLPRDGPGANPPASGASFGGTSGGSGGGSTNGLSSGASTAGGNGSSGTPGGGSPAGGMHPEVQALIVDLCTMPPIPDFYSLHQMLMHGIVSDSVPVALRLIDMSDGYPPAFQAALDMLTRQRAYSTIVDIYAKHGMPDRAARCAITYNEPSVNAAELLRAAAQADDEAAQMEEALKQRSFFTEEESLTELKEHPGVRRCRSMFAQVYMMLRPRLRVVSATTAGGTDPTTATATANTLLSVQPKMGSPTSPVLGSRSQSFSVRSRDSLNDSISGSPRAKAPLFTMTAEEIEPFAARFTALQEKATDLSR